MIGYRSIHNQTGRNPRYIALPKKHILRLVFSTCVSLHSPHSARRMQHKYTRGCLPHPCTPPVTHDMHPPSHASPYSSGALRWKSISFAKQSGRLPQHGAVMESDGWPPYRDIHTKHNYSSCQHRSIHHLPLSRAKGSVPLPTRHTKCVRVVC